MKKTIKIIAIIVAVALLLGILFFANAFVGNPISKMLVSISSDKYIKEEYGELNLVIEDPTFNFKDGNYFIRIHSEDIEDLHFTLYYSMFGKLQIDLYENNITDGLNVLNRVSDDYRNQVEPVLDTLENDALFYGGEHFFASAWLKSKIQVNDLPELYKDFDGGIDSTKLQLDKLYDIEKLGKQGGWIDVSVSFADLDTSYERGAEALLQIKETLDSEGIGFYYIGFGVFNSEGNYAYHIENFTYKDIYKEGLEDRIEKAYKSSTVSYDKWINSTP